MIELEHALKTIRHREIQMIGAGISKQSWHEVEAAYNQLRDKMDELLRAPAPRMIPARDGIEAQRALNDVFPGDMVPAEGISPDAYDRAPKHYYWMAGEADCPSDIKAANGELHTLRCRICELDNPRNPICHADAMFERFARPAT